MPDFLEFQLKAKTLTEKISGAPDKDESNFGCFSLFKGLVLIENAAMDVSIISRVASSLDEENDGSLIRFLQQKKNHSLLTRTEFFEFKTKVLTGCYLLKWQQYDKYQYRTVIEQFKKDLNISSLSDFSEEYMDACLASFSQYCSFIYENHSYSVYNNLNKQLGDSIQVEIHSARYPTTTASSIINEVVSAGMQTIGIKS